MNIKHILPYFFLFFILISSSSIALSQSSILVVEMEDTIDRSSVELLSDALKEANNKDHDAVILLLNTPGGGLQETFEIAGLIQNSSIPVVGFVFPKASYAWSAGTFILVSTHLAAMADHTIIGSCQPVEISIQGTRVINDSKTINALVSWIQERASIYGRNITLAKEFITKNRNVNATTALSLGIIEATASSIPDLLNTIDGFSVSTVDGNVTLQTRNATAVHFSPSFQVELLKIISNPMLTSILFMLGLFALIIGLSSPGYGAEVFGVIAILLSFIGSGFSISELSIIFLAIGGVLLFIELFVTPGFGIIGTGGIICFIIGSIFLIPTYTNREWVISMSWIDNLIVIIAVVGTLFAVFFIYLLFKILQIRKKKKAVGVFIGEYAKTVDALIPGETGYVRFKGELWQATSDVNIEKNMKVKIVEKEGSTLIVKPLEGATKH